LLYNPLMARSHRSTAKTQHRAAELRNSATTAESRLWAYLRLKRIRGARFRRQHPIGRYIVDFCAPEANLIIELDGSQHLRQVNEDSQRTQFLESRGYRVLRFWNSDVQNDLDGVVKSIQDALTKP
jgi:very-short-patch-repair endonuclease